MLTVDEAPPVGIPLLWPFGGHVAFSFTPFTNIHHGPPGSDNLQALAEVFSAHNAMAMLTELAIAGPVLVAAWVVFGKRGR